MNTINYEIDISAPVGRVYEYYTNPDNIKKAWRQDIVKESESVSGTKGEEGSEIKVEGEYMGREEEMILQVTDKEESKRFVTEQKEGPFKFWKSTQEFYENGTCTNENLTKLSKQIINKNGTVDDFLKSLPSDNTILAELVC